MSYQVLAPMAGSIYRIEVIEGDAVTEASVLLIMESMKMEIPVGSTEAGVIEEICVQEGQTVENGTVLVRVRV